jgi:acetoin utilization deacetylase AcuC-like enzyme
VFNDAAVAARLMQAEHGRRGRALRVAVIDLDVHQGNGTAKDLPRRPDGLHAVAARPEELPFRKEAATSTSTCPTAAGDDEYLQALEAPWPNWSAASIPGW